MLALTASLNTVMEQVLAPKAETAAFTRLVGILEHRQSCIYASSLSDLAPELSDTTMKPDCMIYDFALLVTHAQALHRHERHIMLHLHVELLSLVQAIRRIQVSLPAYVHQMRCGRLQPIDTWSRHPGRHAPTFRIYLVENHACGHSTEGWQFQNSLRKHPDHGRAQDQSYSSARHFRIAPTITTPPQRRPVRHFKQQSDARKV